ncbi:MAG: SH3 domain-containing protein [Anaerolineae bacterium]|nr:SH3 domain-containing protein [Anaerolineae bacterium]
MMKKSIWWLISCGVGVFFLLSGMARAQETDNCPQRVLVALARAGAVCQRIEHEQACYGYGSVAATITPDMPDVTFAAVGDFAPISALRDLRVQSTNSPDWSVVMLQIGADLVDTEQRSITFLLFGDAAITNQVPFTPEIMITSTGTLYVRETPDMDAAIITRLGLRDTAMANGRTEDGQWLRITIPNTSQLAWVSREVLTTQEDINQLDIVDETTPFFRPFQVFTLQSGTNDAPCSGTPESGLLIQTPNTFTEVTLIVNGVTLRIAATAFLQTDESGLAVHVLDGYAEVRSQGSAQYVPAGAQAHIALDANLVAAGAPDSAVPYPLVRLESLPLNNLSYRFALPEPPSQDTIDQLVAAYYAPPPTPVPAEDEAERDRCVRETHRNASLWAGPGMYYEVVRPIAFGTRVYPVYQVTDAENIVWWQLTNNNWIRVDAVTSTGECADVPITDVIRVPPTNTLTLERCDTSNGPIRPGQRVTIEFTPSAFKTYNEAIAGMAFDPGRITVGSQAISVYASNPIKIAEERYIRVFRGTWIAQAGTYRIVGQRLSYILNCDITVPLGR